VRLSICRALFILLPASLCASQQTPEPARPNVLVGYTLGPGDQITIIGSEPEEIINKAVRVDQAGFLTLPLVGKLQAGGLTVEQFQKQLEAVLRQWVLDPQVSASVTEYRSQSVSVIGSVASPGVQILQGRKTIAEVLAQAGGIRQDAGYQLRITRRLERGRIPVPGAHDDPTGRFSVAELAVSGIIESGGSEQNIVVEAGDVLSVPRGEMIFVLGNVRRPGGFVLNDRGGMSVLQALSLAEGTVGHAATANARILRKVNGQPERTEVHVDLKRIFAAKAKDVPMLPDDILFIPSNTTKAVMLRAVEAAASIGTGLIIYRP
jgi:polysaccharide biosynthesis/export protein